MATPEFNLGTWLRGIYPKFASVLDAEREGDTLNTVATLGEVDSRFAVNSVPFNAHLINAANPHGVTAAQTGAVSLTQFEAFASREDNPHQVTAAQTGAATTADITAALNADGANWSGGKTIGGSLTVSGNLTVEGTTTSVDHESVTTTDNMITLNAGEVGAGVTAGESGVMIDRGSKPEYRFVFVEADENFQIGVGSPLGETDPVITSGAPVITSGAKQSILQPVATRPDSSELTDGALVVWSGENYRFETSTVTPEEFSQAAEFVGLLNERVTALENGGGSGSGGTGGGTGGGVPSALNIGDVIRKYSSENIIEIDGSQFLRLGGGLIDTADYPAAFPYTTAIPTEDFPATAMTADVTGNLTASCSSRYTYGNPNTFAYRAFNKDMTDANNWHSAENIFDTNGLPTQPTWIQLTLTAPETLYIVGVKVRSSGYTVSTKPRLPFQIAEVVITYADGSTWSETLPELETWERGEQKVFMFQTGPVEGPVKSIRLNILKQFANADYRAAIIPDLVYITGTNASLRNAFNLNETAMPYSFVRIA